MMDASYYETQATRLEAEARAHDATARTARRAGDEHSAMALEAEADQARRAAAEMRSRARRVA